MGDLEEPVYGGITGVNISERTCKLGMSEEERTNGHEEPKEEEQKEEELRELEEPLSPETEIVQQVTIEKLMMEFILV